MAADYWSSLQLLSLAARAVQRESATYLKAIGLPQLGFYVLEYLNEQSPRMQSELARLVLVRTQTIRVVLSTLEDKHWITRQHGIGQNQVAVSITEQGLTLLVAAQERLESLQLPTDLEALRPFLSTIIRRTAH